MMTWKWSLRTVEDRIREYLLAGGLFNPELAIHDAVRELLIDCRNEIAALRAERDHLRQFEWMYKDLCD